MFLIDVPSTIEPGDSSSPITLDRSELETDLDLSDPYWSSSTNWEFVSVLYTDATGSEHKELIFYPGIDEAIFSVSDFVRENTWTIQKIILSDFDGGIYVAPAADIPNVTDYDIEVDSGANPDAFASFLELALPLRGSNGGTIFSDTFVSGRISSLKSIVNNGSGVTSVTAQSQFYGSSCQFTGAGGYLEIDGGGFNFGTGDYTVEFWIYSADTMANQFIVGFRPLSTPGGVDLTTGGPANGTTTGVFIASLSGGADNSMVSTSELNDSTWHHCAITRDSGTTRMFVDGIITNTGTDNNNYTSATNRPVLGINDFNVSSNSLIANLQDVRVYVGVAKYTANFTPPGPII